MNAEVQISKEWPLAPLLQLSISLLSNRCSTQRPFSGNSYPRLARTFLFGRWGVLAVWTSDPDADLKSTGRERSSRGILQERDMSQKRAWEILTGCRHSLSQQ
jgi:hypothetical protein